MNKFYIYIVTGYLLVGCSKPPIDSIDPIDSNIKSKTEYEQFPHVTGSLLTVEHDGHWFVLEGRYNKGAMLHHPDCPCGKSVE